MTGRGIDQILPHPSDPALYEPGTNNAKEYVKLAEQVTGPISTPVDFAYIWGDALAELQHVAPDARIINLETAVTRSKAWEDKEINYRMSPDNIACLTAAQIDCAVLANNHVLDWGTTGLVETADTLHKAGIATAEMGRTLTEAEAPREQRQNASRTLHSADRRVSVTIHPGLPARVEVVHKGLPEAEMEAVLMALAAEIPSPCVLLILPKVCWDVV